MSLPLGRELIPASFILSDLNVKACGHGVVGQFEFRLIVSRSMKFKLTHYVPLDPVRCTPGRQNCMPKRSLLEHVTRLEQRFQWTLKIRLVILWDVSRSQDQSSVALYRSRFFSFSGRKQKKS